MGGSGDRRRAWRDPHSEPCPLGALPPALELRSEDPETWETIFEYRTHPQETVLIPAGATTKHRFDGVDVHFEIDPASERNYLQLEASDES